MRFCYITQIGENDMHMMHSGGVLIVQKNWHAGMLTAGEPVSTLPVQMNI